MKTSPSTALQEDLQLLVPPSELHGQLAARSHWLMWALLGLVLLAGYFLLRRRARAAQGQQPRPDPGALALKELLQWSDLSDPARYREAVAAVSAIMRRYVENRFGLQAPRLTTEEFWEQLRMTRPMPPAYDPFWENFMHECDVIKYAGYSPGTPQLQRLLQSAAEFVREAENGKARAA